MTALTGCIPSSDAPPGPNRAADLANLELSEGALSPAFGPDELNYTVSVGSNVSAITITPTVADARATVKINNNPAQSGQPFGPINLVLGTNPPITILVDGPGVSKSYVIIVTRAPNADLQALELSAGALAPAFSPNETNYMVETGFNTQSTTVTARVADDTSTLTINGNAANSGQPFGPVTLAVGSSNVIVIRVTAANGVTKDYQVTVLRIGTTNLSDLRTSAGPIAPAFNPNTLAYTVSTGFTTDQTTINVSTADDTAAVTVNGQGPVQGGGTFGPFPLAPGQQNPFTIVVTSPTVASKTYSVTITRQPPSSNALLSGLSVNPGALQPDFSSNIFNYSVDVASTVSTISVTATRADTNASVAINGVSGSSRTISLNPAGTPTVISIVVVAQDGTTRNYIITVNRTLSGNNNLQSLSVSPGSLSPSFNANTLNYSVNVPSNVGSVTVTASPQDSNATVSINGQTTTSRSVTLGAAGSSTLISIAVTAPNGSQKTYSVVVNRAALGGNNNLQSLTVSPGTLSPSFNANTLNYTVDVGSGVGSVTVTATPQDGGATVSINGQTTTSRSVTLGPAGSSTSISVVVTAPNGSQKTYSVVVNRAALGGNNNLQSLSVSPGTLSPSFDANTLNYTVNVAGSVSSVTVTAMPQDNSATVSINGQTTTSRSVALGPDGTSTSISIVVTAPNGSQKTYTVIANRAALSGNNNLQSLTVSPGTLSPSFNANTLNYTVNVASNVGSVTVTATPQDGSATVSINGQTTTSRSVTLGPAGTSTPISVVVTAPNGDQKTYSITVNRAAPQSTNANLSGLSLSAGSLSPAFAPSTLSYSVTTTQSSTTVTATVQDSTATMTVSLNGASPVGLSNGQPSPPLSLNLGANTIVVRVTAQAGNTQDYTVTVTRNP